MTPEQMKADLTARTGESDDDVLTSYLDEAAQIVINHAYPFADDVVAVPRKYQRRQIEIAAYLLNKRGADGQSSHKENGIDRTYESASVPDSMLNDIMPYCKVPTGDNDENAET